jgi:ATP:corrinoid adenosyltransferase
MPEMTKPAPMEPRGLVVVITSHGKGKTTTAFQIAVRACGHDMRVCSIQVMKGDLYSGEWGGKKGNPLTGCCNPQILIKFQRPSGIREKAF